MRTIIIFTACMFFLANSFAQATDNSLQITPLAGDFYIYETYNLYKGNKIPANGMYLVTTEGVVLFDTPWDTAQFQPLLDSIQLRHHKSVVLCIASHFHDDRTAGLEYYKQQGIKTYTTVLTDELSKKNNKKRAEYLISKDTTFTIGGYSFETYYPGPGHTSDNIVYWFKKQKILYGACLIKSVEDDDLGYLGDANKMEYASTIKRVQQKFLQPKYVIVGHGEWRNPASLKHTRAMAEVLKKETAKAAR